MTEPDVERLRELCTKGKGEFPPLFFQHYGNDVLWLIDDRQRALDRIAVLEEAVDDLETRCAELMNDY